MLFLLPIIILSVILLGWTYMMTSVIVGIFPIFSVWLAILAMAGTIAFIVGIIGANVWPRRLFSRIYFSGAVSLGAITLAGFVAILFLIFAQLSNISYSSTLSLIVFIVAAIGVNLWGIYASWIPRITRYSVQIDKTHTWHGKKIVMIADTHYGNIYGVREARSLIKRINALKPEIVLIPGDFFDGPLIDYASIVREFAHIEAPHGIFFANGNHEEYTHTKEIIKSIKNPFLVTFKKKTKEKIQDTLGNENQSINVINNEKVEIDGIVFAGVTYHDTEDVAGLRKNLDSLSLDPVKPTILLKHKPTLHKILEQYPIDLVVSGHTHRAQMWPFSIVTYVAYGAYVYGKVVKNGLTAITTSGVGSWGPPQRVGTRSEIVVIEID